MVTFLLSIAGCVLLFLGIWGVTVTMPTRLLAKNFPLDVQERLKPRLDTLRMSPRRVIGWIIMILLVAAYIGLFIIGGRDGIRNGFYSVSSFCGSSSLAQRSRRLTLSALTGSC